MKLTRIRLEFKLEDMWVGVFWKHGFATLDSGKKKLWTDIWLCLLPCLPVHLTVVHKTFIPFESNNNEQA